MSERMSDEQADAVRIVAECAECMGHPSVCGNDFDRDCNNGSHPTCPGSNMRIETVARFALAERERVRELEAENERLRGVPSTAGKYVDCEDEYEYHHGRCYHTVRNTICPCEPLCHDENIEGRRYEVIVRAALGTQSTTDSGECSESVPEGAVVCWCCNGGIGAVFEHGLRVVCPTCHGTGHVCEVCGGAVGEPGLLVGETIKAQCCADYHKEEK